MVLIHGAMASLHTWEGWVTALGENYRLITLDLPAHGLTGAAPADAKTPTAVKDLSMPFTQLLRPSISDLSS